MNKIQQIMKARYDAMTPEQRARIDALIKRYTDAAHAMQSGVAMDLSTGGTNGSPKQLRVGVNSSMVENSALCHLLIIKGIISEEEWYDALASMMEYEVETYEKRLSEKTGGVTKVTLA